MNVSVLKKESSLHMALSTTQSLLESVFNINVSVLALPHCFCPRLAVQVMHSADISIFLKGISTFKKLTYCAVPLKHIVLNSSLCYLFIL